MPTARTGSCVAWERRPTDVRFRRYRAELSGLPDRGPHLRRVLAVALVVTGYLACPQPCAGVPLRSETKGQAGACPDRARAPLRDVVPRCVPDRTGKRRDFTVTPGEANTAPGWDGPAHQACADDLSSGSARAMIGSAQSW
jgi:hypothetical protein